MKKKTKPQRYRGLIVACSCIGMLYSGFSAADPDAQHSFEVKPQNMGDAFVDFSQQSNVQVVYTEQIIASAASPGISGTHSTQEGFEKLIDGTSLNYEFTNANTIRVYRVAQNTGRQAGGEKSESAAKVGNGSELPDGSSSVGTVKPRGAARFMEEVLVTSRKKSVGEAVQSVPTAISAFSEGQIEANFAADLNDIGLLIPNVQLNNLGTFPGNQSFYIRGMGVNSSIPTEDPATGVFVDGVYLGVNASAMLDTFDIESIEVMRGPQGTLFGRNVTGGAISVRTKRPTGEFGGQAKITVGTADRRDVAVSVEGALVEDRVNAKIAYLSKERDGYVKNVNPDFPGDTLGEVDTWIVRPMVEFQLSDTFDLTLIGEYGEDGGDSGATTNINDPTKLASSEYGYTPPDDIYKAAPNNAGGGTDPDIGTADMGGIDFEHNHLIAEANWDVGHGVITSITGWREVNQRSSTDFDGTPFTIFHFSDVRLDQDQFSEELRYASNFSEVFDFTVGLYYFEQTIEYKERRHLLVGVQGPNGLEVAGSAKQDQTTWGIFTQGDYHFNDELSLTLGARYTKEKKEMSAAPIGTCSLDFVCSPTAFVNADESWSNFTPKIGINYQLTEENLLFGSWTKGFRSGGFNARPNSAENIGPYDEETVKTLEFGSKNDFMDGQLRLNLAFFRNEFEGLQRQVILPGFEPRVVQGTLNAADAVTQGFEAEIVFVPTSQLAINGSVGYLDASYDNFDGFDLTGDGIPDPGLAKDLDFERVPERTAHIGVTYDIPFEGIGTLILRGSYNYKGEWYGDVRNSPEALHPSTELFDASITFIDESDTWSLSLAGKNLADEEYFAWLVPAGSLSLNAWGQTPRTWLVEAKYQF